MKEVEPNEWTLKEWHDNPKNWKLGVLYVNTKDKRVFLPNRFYGGLTLNFANPLSIIVLVALIALMVLVTMVVKN